MAIKITKLTVSIPQDLIEFADELAKEKKTSRSKVVSACLRELANRRLIEQMEEGYKAMARENLEFAETAMDLAHEVIPEWK